MELSTDKKKRRSRADNEGRNFICDCGKKYFSYQALYTHKKSKHSEIKASQETSTKKRGRPKLDPPNAEENFVEISTKIQKSFENSERWSKIEAAGTCDDVFREYLRKMRKKLSNVQFASLKCSMNALRECINKHSDKVDPNYFFSDDVYTVTEKADLIPNICNFFILEYLPKEYQSHVKTDEVHFILEFCKWLNKKNYTELEISIGV